MINVIINGYRGRMGTVLRDLIERTEKVRVVAGVDPLVGEGRQGDIPTYASLGDVKEDGDVVIDFSNPDGIESFLDQIVLKKLPVVIATTGLTEAQQAAVVACAQNVPVFQAANMSLGINVLKRLLRDTAAVLGSSFDIEIVERHHKMKRDAPSGTALALAEAIRETIDAPRGISSLEEADVMPREETEIGIHALRGGTIVGEHDVLFAGNDEVLVLGHKAYSRGLFAGGALKAAQYVVGKAPGLYGMEDLVAESTVVTRLASTNEALVAFSNIPATPQASFEVLQAFATAGISVDMIRQSAAGDNAQSLSFSVRQEDTDRVTDIVRGLEGGAESIRGTVTGGLRKIILEGMGKELPSNVAARIFGILRALDIEAMAVAISETRIACLVQENAHQRVITAIQEAYNL